MTGEKITVEKLYELCEVLDNAKENVTEKSGEYLQILEGSKSGLNEKKLTSQLIVRYFHRFPEQRDKALDSVFELCEDDDVNIRKFVIRNLASLCKESGPNVSKVADVLTQLLQTEDAEEQKIVQTALKQLLTKFTKDTLVTIFGHVLNAEEDLIRERAVKFLALNLKQLPASSATVEIQTFIIEEIKKIMVDVTGDEFVLLMHIMSSLSTMQTVTGRKQLLELVTEQADLDKDFDANEPDRVDQICQCSKQAIPFLSKNVDSTKFMEFLLNKVMAKLADIAGDNASASRLEMLRVTAEISTFCGTLSDPNTQLTTLFNALQKYLPLPPSESGEENGAANENEDPKIGFSEIECLLYTFHQLAKKHPDFLGKPDEERTEKIKEFRKKLQYVARVIQVYSKKLRTILSQKKKEEMIEEEVAKSENEPRKLVGAPQPDVVPTKRVKSDRSPVSYYAPPGGKFSEKAGAPPERGEGENRGRRGGGGGGGYRGRGGRGGGNKRRWY